MHDVNIAYKSRLFDVLDGSVIAYSGPLLDSQVSAALLSQLFEAIQAPDSFLLCCENGIIASQRVSDSLMLAVHGTEPAGMLRMQVSNVSTQIETLL